MENHSGALEGELQRHGRGGGAQGHGKWASNLESPATPLGQASLTGNQCFPYHSGTLPIRWGGSVLKSYFLHAVIEQEIVCTDIWKKTFFFKYRPSEGHGFQPQRAQISDFTALQGSVGAVKEVRFNPDSVTFKAPSSYLASSVWNERDAYRLHGRTCGFPPRGVNSHWEGDVRNSIGPVYILEIHTNGTLFRPEDFAVWGEALFTSQKEFF